MYTINELLKILSKYKLEGKGNYKVILERELPNYNDSQVVFISRKGEEND